MYSHLLLGLGAVRDARAELRAQLLGLYTREHYYSSLPLVFTIGIPVYTKIGRVNDESPSSKQASAPSRCPRCTRAPFCKSSSRLGVDVTFIQAPLTTFYDYRESLMKYTKRQLNGFNGQG